MVDGGVDAASVRMKAADRNVIQGDQRGEDKHGREVPEAAVSGESEGDAQNVGNGRTPVAIEDGGAAEPPENARAAGCIFNDPAGGTVLGYVGGQQSSR